MAYQIEPGNHNAQVWNHVTCSWDYHIFIYHEEESFQKYINKLTDGPYSISDREFGVMDFWNNWLGENAGFVMTSTNSRNFKGRLKPCVWWYYKQVLLCKVPTGQRNNGKVCFKNPHNRQDSFLSGNAFRCERIDSNYFLQQSGAGLTVCGKVFWFSGREQSWMCCTENR